MATITLITSEEREHYERALGNARLHCQGLTVRDAVSRVARDCAIRLLQGDLISRGVHRAVVRECLADYDARTGCRLEWQFVAGSYRQVEVRQ